VLLLVVDDDVLLLVADHHDLLDDQTFLASISEHLRRELAHLAEFLDPGFARIGSAGLDSYRVCVERSENALILRKRLYLEPELDRLAILVGADPDSLGKQHSEIVSRLEFRTGPHVESQNHVLDQELQRHVLDELGAAIARLSLNIMWHTGDQRRGQNEQEGQRFGSTKHALRSNDREGAFRTSLTRILLSSWSTDPDRFPPP
jgi:hypothetical protein